MDSACCSSLVGDTMRSHKSFSRNVESCVKTNFRHLFLWLFVINLGISFGAGLYEARVVIPQWVNLPPRTWPNTGILFWVYVTTIPLTLLTVANLFAAWLEPKKQVVALGGRHNRVGAGRNLCLFHSNNDQSHGLRTV